MTTNTAPSDTNTRPGTAKPLTVRVKTPLSTPFSEKADSAVAATFNVAEATKVASSVFAEKKAFTSTKYVFAPPSAEKKYRGAKLRVAAFSAKVRALWARIYFKTVF